MTLISIFILMFFLVALTIGCVLLFLRHRILNMVVIGFAVALVVVFTLMISFISGRVTSPVSANQVEKKVEVEFVGAVGRAKLEKLALKQPWTPTVMLESQQQMTADLYPSIDSAAQGLIARLGQGALVAKIDPNAIYVLEIPQTLLHVHVQNLVDTLVSQGVVESQIRMREIGENDIGEVVHAAQPPLPASASAENQQMQTQRQDDAKTIVIRLAREGSSGVVHHLRLTMLIDSLPVILDASYLNAPWIESTGAYQASLKDEPVFVGYSDLVDSVEMAKKQAREHLAAVMLKAITDADDVILEDGEIVVVRIEDSLNKHSYLKQYYKINDIFLQSFDRPYGKLWRQAVMINTPPHRFETSSGSYLQHDLMSGGKSDSKLFKENQLTFSTEEQAAQDSKPSLGIRMRVISMVLVMGFVGVLYFVAEWATKGYCRKPIRWTTLMVLLGLSALVFIAGVS